jgi:hypothetical protein
MRLRAGVAGERGNVATMRANVGDSVDSYVVIRQLV